MGFQIENGVLKKHTQKTGETDVVIPDGVTAIGRQAFLGCRSLTAVTIPDGVATIEENAFVSCSSLTSVIIPGSVTSIGRWAFSSCSSLTTVVIPDSVTTIGDGAFSGCSSNLEIHVSSLEHYMGLDIGGSHKLFVSGILITDITSLDCVSSIGENAFRDCNSLRSIIIPDGVTTIGSCAFWSCSSLTSVVIPDSVTSIGNGAFWYCNSSLEIHVSSLEHYMGLNIDGSHKLFVSGILITDITNLDCVSSINANAFDGCNSLRSIIIPDSVTTIGESAFSDCSSLRSIIIPDSVTTIGNWAFSDCSNLTTVIIPDSVTTIGLHAFWGCSNLEIHVSSLEHYMGLSIDGSHKLFVNGILITDVTNLAPADSIGENAFSDCSSLRSIIIPDSVTSIGRCAFFGCGNLTSIVIPDSVTSIGSCAFWDCSSLTSIIIPNSVTTIGSQAFHSCSSLTSITVPNSVTAIGDSAFYDCSSLTSIIIPDSVKVITKDVFSGCNAVRNIQISPSTLASCKDLSFWEYIIPRLSLHDLIAAIKKCPKKLMGKAEKIILRSDNIEAVRYFEQQNRLEEYAAFHNTDADTLRDSILSDFGLDEQGCRSWPLAGSFITARMEKNLSITLLDANGKVLRSVPKKGADPAEYDAAKKEVAQLKKDIASAAKLRNNRLLADFLEARPRSAESWKATYLKNPLLKALAKLVVWQQGEKNFILAENGTPIDAAGKEIPLGDEEILLAHPMEMGSELTKAWQDYFLNRHLSQPFAQVWEPVLDGSTITPDRYAGATIPQYMLMNKELHGITMEGQCRLKLRDCTADLAFVQEHRDWVNNEYEITNFRFEKFTRAVNHIAAHFDKGTVLGRLLKDDASAAQWLDYFTLAQITDFIARVTEKGDCPNSAAALLEYKQTKYPDTDPFADFVLEW